jgi:hypothetical protein
MTSSTAKVLKYRYQSTIFDTVYDLDGSKPIPVKDGIVLLKDGKNYKIVNVNFSSGAKGQVPWYDVVVEELR